MDGRKEILHLIWTDEDLARWEIEKKDVERLGHVGTHIDCYTDEPQQKEYEMEVVVVDCRQGIPAPDALSALELEGKALMLYTGNLSARGYATPSYFMYDMGMDWSVLQLVLQKRPRFILIDSHGLGLFSQHRLFDTECEKNGCFVIMSLNLDGEDVLHINRVRIEIDLDMASTGKPCRIRTI